jgi:phosphoribosylaminoimidazole carboxylase PurE protein
MKKVAIIMGSDSDLPVVRKAAEVLREFGVPYEAHVWSAHRTPDEVRVFCSSARERGFGVIIAAAGMAAHLAGAVAALTTIPVVGIPIKSGNLGGVDALLSTVQMPPEYPWRRLRWTEESTPLCCRLKYSRSLMRDLQRSWQSAGGPSVNVFLPETRPLRKN